MTKGPPIAWGFGSSRTPSAPHHFLSSAASLDHGYSDQATKGSGRRSLLIERGHRRHECREGYNGYRASQGCFWLRQRRSHYDKSGFPGPSQLIVDKRTQDSMANEADYIDLGLACADVCKALDRGLNGRRADELSQSVFEAIIQLTM